MSKNQEEGLDPLPLEDPRNYVGCPLCQGEGGDIETGRRCPQCGGFGVIDENTLKEY